MIKTKTDKTVDIPVIKKLNGHNVVREINQSWTILTFRSTNLIRRLRSVTLTCASLYLQTTEEPAAWKWHRKQPMGRSLQRLRTSCSLYLSWYSVVLHFQHAHGNQVFSQPNCTPDISHHHHHRHHYYDHREVYFRQKSTVHLQHYKIKNK